MKDLYGKEDIHLMRAADDVDAFDANRIEAIRQFATTAGMKRIGIANCIVFSRQTKTLIKYFSQDFEVFSADCKYGRMTREQLFGENNRQVLCNPAGQADFLNQKNTDLNISVGLCVGHDMIFSQKSRAPVTSLFVKDFVTDHDSAEALAQIALEML
ncbi:MAG: hypothetical protein H6R19_1917 [Proteobacteria bacterium]|nr:hypothetical protein [Pseudomonadota bacterium]